MNLLEAIEIATAAGIVSWMTMAQLSAHYLSRRCLPDRADPPSNYGIAYHEVQFPSRDGVPLVGWWIPANTQADTAPNPVRGTIIISHGQSGSMDGDTPQMVPLHRAGFNVLMFDYRAHGRSGGDHITYGVFEREDLLGALDFLQDTYGVRQVGVLGFSMGAAVAIMAAAITDRFGALVADSSYARFKNTMARLLKRRGVPYHLAWHMAAWTLLAVTFRIKGRMDQVDPALWLPHVRCPVLFIHGDSDPFISEPEADEMAAIAAGKVERWVVPGAGHREAWLRAPDEYNRRVVGWFTAHLPGGKKDSVG